MCEYIRSLRNDIAVDIRTLEMVGLDAEQYGKIPRPAFWIAKIRPFPLLSRIVQYILQPVWYLLGPLFFRLQCHAVQTGPRPTRVIKFDVSGQVIPFSARCMDIVNPGNIHPIPKQWIEFPWLPLNNLPNDAEVLPALELLEPAEIQQSFVLATWAHFIIQHRLGVSEWGLQSYTAWRWFFARLALDKLPGPILSTEHFDRWAVLIDGSIRWSRGRKSMRCHTIVQHGSVNADSTPRGLGFHLPTRLAMVTHLCAYSAADIDVFRREILSPRCAANINVSFYCSKISLVALARPGGAPSILFVGHPLCESAHCELLASLLKNGDWQLFYKTHPTIPSRPALLKLPWTVLQERQAFPCVDLLISYPSTMVTEYAAHGIPAIVHSMDVSPQEILNRIPEILRVIQSRHDHTIALASL